MTTNMGKTDRILRVAIAALLAYVAFGTGLLGAGVLQWLAIAVAAIFTLTAIVGNCPLYSIVGIRTCKVNG
jgi:predicted membrane-bound dolichyl-phosphate-mannose-protein mannosyltransferase